MSASSNNQSQSSDQEHVPMPKWIIPANPNKWQVKAVYDDLVAEAKLHGWPEPQMPKIFGKRESR